MLQVSRRYLFAVLLIVATPAVHGAGSTDANDNTTLGAGAGANLDTDGSGDDAFLNTIIGTAAGQATTTGDSNVFVGEDSGLSNTIGDRNVFVGGNAGRSNTMGNDNVFVGISAGLANTTGNDNVFIGNDAGNANTIGELNTFIGNNAGRFNTDGGRNVFVGNDAGRDNTTGLNNTFIGEDAGFSNTEGAQNVFVGKSTGIDNTTGEFNTFVGASAGNSNTAGDSNTFVGRSAGANATGSGNIFLGVSAGFPETGSNRLYIENSAASDPLVYGEFDNDLVAVNGILGVGTQLPSASVHVRRSDGTANLLVEEANSTVAPRQLYTLENNGPIAFGMVNNDLAQEWRFAAQTTGFRISLGGSGGQEFEVGNDGTLAVGPAGTQNLFLDTSGNLTIQGTLTEVSSRTAKESIQAVDATAVLSRLAQLDLSRWSYKGQGARHLGPMAEEFHAAFGLGEDARHIAPKDLAGVALASAKALQARVDQQQNTIERQRQRMADQERELKAMRARLEELEALKEQIAQIGAALPEQAAVVGQ